MSDPSIPPVTREALQDGLKEALKRWKQALNSCGRYNAVYCEFDDPNDERAFRRLDAFAAAPVAHSPQPQEEEADTRVDESARPAEPCTAASVGGDALMYRIGWRLRNVGDQVIWEQALVAASKPPDGVDRKAILEAFQMALDAEPWQINHGRPALTKESLHYLMALVSMDILRYPV